MVLHTFPSCSLYAFNNNNVVYETSPVDELAVSQLAGTVQVTIEVAVQYACMCTGSGAELGTDFFFFFGFVGFSRQFFWVSGFLSIS